MGCALDFAVAEFELLVAGGQPLCEFPLFRFVPLALGNVACNGVDNLLLGYGHGIPQEPFVGAVFAQVAIFKGKDFMIFNLVSLGSRSLTIVWMNELQVRLGKKLLSSKTQGSFKRGVEALEKSIETSNAKHV